jgi:hypothetical protein
VRLVDEAQLRREPGERRLAVPNPLERRPHAHPVPVARERLAGFRPEGLAELRRRHGQRQCRLRERRRRPLRQAAPARRQRATGKGRAARPRRSSRRRARAPPPTTCGVPKLGSACNPGNPSVSTGARIEFPHPTPRDTPLAPGEGRQVGVFIELAGPGAERIAIRQEGVLLWRRRLLPITTVASVFPEQRPSCSTSTGAGYTASPGLRRRRRGRDT